MKPETDPQEKAMAAQARLAAIVIAVTMVLWVGLSWIGGKLGWDPRYAFLFDFAALAAFFWALVVVWRVWRKRQ
ncbi:DUF5337 family protein [Acidimangrovimonas pyrenivorans]|uniref:DUF5337 family protein n=1 Tax=Acidimangrovimonas pyrenivorans TaxID=2030798 RepID=A0ABV7AE82_9RHOB